jgi:single-strand DNA-binding protein
LTKKNYKSALSKVEVQKTYLMNTLRNTVQLIGRLGQDPEVVTFQDGNKIAKFSLATDDSYKDKTGNKVERAYWHNIVVSGGLVKVVEGFVKKGQEIAIEGKLTNRSYDTKEGDKRYITEIFVNELLLLGGK